MTSTIGTIHVKRARGKLVVQGEGRTDRGQKYIIDVKKLDVETPGDPQFKAELALAVKEMIGREPTPI